MDNIRGSAREENGPPSGRDFTGIFPCRNLESTTLEISPLNQSKLDLCIKNILSDHEKANELIHQQETNALRKQYEDEKARTDELQKQLAERDSQLQTANVQLQANTVEIETLKTQLAEMQRTNTDLLTKNHELDEFHSDLDQLFKRKKRSLQPVVALQAVDVGENSGAGGADAAAPLVQDLAAATQRLETATPAAGDSVPVVTEVAAPSTEHSASSQSSIDNMPPELPVLAALLDEPNSTELEMATVSSAITRPEPPQVARPKKKVTFSPGSPEVHVFQPAPSMGKRKRAEPLATPHLCKACRVEYESPAELSGHVCSSSPHHQCSVTGCRKTFYSQWAKLKHEKTHADMEDD